MKRHAVNRPRDWKERKKKEKKKEKIKKKKKEKKRKKERKKEILRSQFLEEDVKKMEHSEHSVVLLVLLFNSNDRKIKTQQFCRLKRIHNQINDHKQ